MDLDLIKRIGDTWSQRASVRSDPTWLSDKNSDAGQPEYPVSSVPFWDHPLFERLPSEKKERVLIWAWLVYNQRTIDAEQKVANPAFELMMNDRFPGLTNYTIKRAIQQSIVDEHFHSLMHMTAIDETKKRHAIEVVPVFPPSITYRALQEAQDQVAESWKKDLLVIAFAIVSEISINAFLELLANATEIRPQNAKIAQYHNRDEYSHASLLVETSPFLYNAMNSVQRNMFVDALPKALEAFVAQDFSAWSVILNHENIQGADQIIADCLAQPSKANLTRDYSGLRRLAQTLDIIDLLDFDFGKAV